MATLKELLGEDFKDGMSIEEVDKALAGKKIADLTLGGYVSKDKFKALEDELQTSQKNLTDSFSKIASLEKSAGDNAELAKQITQLKSDLESQKADFENRAKTREKEYLFTDQIKEFGAKNVKAVKAVISDLFNLDNAEIKDGKLDGLEDALNKVKAENDYLFTASAPSVPKAGRETGKPPAVSAEDALLKAARKAAGLE